MKRIRMTEQYSGPRFDGRMWPTAGAEFEVDDEEAEGLVRQGVAELVAPPKAKPPSEPPVVRDPAPEGTAKPPAVRKAAAGK